MVASAKFEHLLHLLYIVSDTSSEAKCSNHNFGGYCLLYDVASYYDYSFQCQMSYNNLPFGGSHIIKSPENGNKIVRWSKLWVF